MRSLVEARDQWTDPGSLGRDGALRARTWAHGNHRGYQFLAFPAEEPPSIECNEDAGQELIDN